MTSKKQVAAKAVPKKDTRKKPGPHARAKNRAAGGLGSTQLAASAAGAVNVSAGISNTLAAAQARLINAQAEATELRNREQREWQARPDYDNAGNVVPNPARSVAAVRPDRLEAAPRSGLEQEQSEFETCQHFTDELLSSLIKRLEPLLNVHSTNTAGGADAPVRTRSGIADWIGRASSRQAELNLALISLHERLDLP